MGEEITKEDIERALADDSLEDPLDLDERTVVYFDQKAWGSLIEQEGLYDLAERSNKELGHIYPFSIENMVETSSAAKVDLKRDLFDKFVSLSNAVSIKNHLPVFDRETLSFLSYYHPLMPDLDVRSYVFDRGVANVASGWTLEPEEEVSEDLREGFRRILRDEEINKKLLQSQEIVDDAPGVTDAEKEQYTRIFKQKKAEMGQAPDINSSQDRAEYITAVFIERIIPLLRGYSADMNINLVSLLVNEVDPYDFESFYSEFPTFYTYATLCFASDALEDREPEFNDLLDISQLAVATPYSDIVVTEQFFGGLLQKFGIDERFDTDVYTEVGRFEEYLNMQLSDKDQS